METAIEIIKSFGVGQGIFIILTLTIIFFLSKYFWKLYNKALESKDKEIERLVEENKSYRLMFQTMIEDKLDLKTSQEKEQLKLKDFRETQKNKR